MMTSHRIDTLLLLLCLAVMPLAAQTDGEKQQLRNQRFCKVDYYHAGIGIDAASGHYLTAGPKIFVGLGSYRSLVTADAGMKLLYANPFGSSSEERVSQLQLPLFAAASVNVLRWHNSSIYIGAELDYHLHLGATHHIPSTSVSDDNLASGHASAALRLGVRLNRWDLGIYYEYDLAPAYDQKYVYESAAYDYEALHDDLFARTRFGISISHLLPF